MPKRLSDSEVREKTGSNAVRKVEESKRRRKTGLARQSKRKKGGETGAEDKLSEEMRGRREKNDRHRLSKRWRSISRIVEIIRMPTLDSHHSGKLHCLLNTE